MYYGEKLNSISHLVGAVFSLVALGALLTLSIQSGDPRMIVGFSVFGLTLVLLYAMSTLYHSFQAPGLKRVFKLLDHISIYLLIAGTYTPFMLISVNSTNGTLILALVWGLAVIGTLSEILLSGRAVKICQLIIYLGMGWACSLDIASLRAGLPEAGFAWLAAGGVIYTVGVIFYVVDKLNRLTHAHGIWHFFVLVGSACHFIAIMGYVR
ncbi:MAG: hemolysin III family protein [Halioglobus sp.]|nr:hemolysin III family protein [Halioglobus sp.]